MNWPNEMRLLQILMLVYLDRKKVNAIYDFLNENEVKLGQLLKLIKGHKLIPVAVVACRKAELGRKHPAFMNRLIEFNRLKQERKKNLIAEQNRVLNFFEKKRIKVVPYKGAGFTSQFYPNKNARHWVDIDLALSQDDIPKAAQVLFDLGYEEHKNVTDFEKIKASRGYEIDFSFVLREDNKIKFNIELHWQPSHNVLYFPLDFNRILDKTCQIEFDQTTFKTFEKPYQAIIVLVHHGLVDCWGKLRHLLDLHYITESLTDNEADMFSGLVSDYGLEKTHAIGKSLISTLIDGTVNQENKQLSNISVTDFLDKIMKNELVGNWSENKTKLKLHLSLRDSYKDKLMVSQRMLRYFFKFHLRKRIFRNG